MFPSDPSAPAGGPQSVTPSILRSNSGLLGVESGSMPSQNGFHSIVSPRAQFNNTNMLGNVPNMSSLVHQSFGNGVPNSGFSGPEGGHRGAISNGASDGISSIGNGMGLNPAAIATPTVGKSNSSGQSQARQFSVSSGNHVLHDQHQSLQLDHRNMQEFSAPQRNHQGQHQYQSVRGGLAGVGPVKLEPQVSNDQNVLSIQQLHSLRNVAPVKLEPQQIQNMKGVPPVKVEPQHLDQSLLLHQQQLHHRQQQQLLHLSRQSPQAVAASQLNLFNQQRLLPLQQQQQLALKSLPPQRYLSQQPLQPQNLPLRLPMKPTYEPGMCAKRLTRYMYEQQHRPKDNHIDFWRKFVSEFFAPNANKKWCVSMYGTGRQTAGVFPQDVWNCGICSCKPGRGFEATAEVLPRLFKIKYESGTMEELLYVDMPREYHNSAGQIVLDYAKATQESVFDKLRVVRDGQLRLVFSPDLKICSWEFCARRHEELIPRRLLVPQVSQIGAVAQKYQAATQNSSSSSLVPELQSTCDTFSASARQLAKAMEVPLVNDLGYTKRFIRCLQISEVVNSMKDLIDYSRETGTGPTESLIKFPRRSNATSVHCQPQEEEDQPQQQETMGQNTVKDQNYLPTDAKPVASGNGPPMNLATNSTTSSSQILSPQAQAYPSLFQPPKPSMSNTAQQNCHGGLPAANSPSFSGKQPSLRGDTDPNDSQSSVQKIINKMMMTSQVNGGDGAVVNDVRIGKGVFPSNGGNCLVGDGTGFGNMGYGLGQSTVVNGVRAPTGSNDEQQPFGDQLFSGLEAVNGFSNFDFDWKSSP